MRPSCTVSIVLVIAALGCSSPAVKLEQRPVSAPSPTPQIASGVAGEGRAGEPGRPGRAGEPGQPGEPGRSGFSWKRSGPAVRGSGRLATETRSVQGVRAVQSLGSIDVVVTIGEPERVIFTADDNILPLLTADVREGTLVLSSTGGYSTREQLRAEVRVARLESITVQGSGGVTASAASGPALRVSVRGSGDVAVGGLALETVDVDVAGSGDVTLQGRCETLAVDVRGSGDVRARELAASRATVDIRGSGDVDVASPQSMSVSIRGSGDVTHGGVPTLDSTIRGSGTIRRR